MKKIAIIGAGVAGANLAYQLKKHFSNITVFSHGQEVPIAFAFISPRIYRHDNIMKEIYNNFFLYAYDFYNSKELKKFIIGRHIPTIKSNIKEHENHLCFFKNNPREIQYDTQLKSFTSQKSFILSSHKLISFLLDGLKKINNKVTQITNKQQKFIIHTEYNCFDFDHIFLACGSGIDDFVNIEHTKLLGEIRFIKEKFIADFNKIKLQYGTSQGSFFFDQKQLLADNGLYIGSSFKRLNHSKTNFSLDKITNQTIQKLIEQFALPIKQSELNKHKKIQGIRISPLNHLPLIGKFSWQELSKNLSKRKSVFNLDNDCLQEIFMLSGLGSHGFQVAPYASDYLVQQFLLEQSKSIYSKYFYPLRTYKKYPLVTP